MSDFSWFWLAMFLVFVAGMALEHHWMSERMRTAQAKANRQTKEANEAMREAQHLADIIQLVNTARGSQQYRNN